MPNDHTRNDWNWCATVIGAGLGDRLLPILTQRLPPAMVALLVRIEADGVPHVSAQSMTPCLTDGGIS
jgi:hypothetical protein